MAARKTTVSPGVYLLTVLLVTWVHPSAGDLVVTLSPSCRKVGDDVTFHVSGSQGQIRFIDWYRGAENNADSQIFRFSLGVTTPGKQYFDAVRGFDNGSMLITNVQRDYEGFYTVDIQADNFLQGKAQLLLQDVCLSGGAIAGIVIAVLVVVVGVIILVYCFFIKKSSVSLGSSSESSKDGSRPQGAASSSGDRAYTAVST